MTLTVYTAPACGGCIATKRHLAKHHLKVSYLPLNSDAEQLAAEHGLLSAPIVHAVLDDGSEQVWGGYRPDRIEALVS